uniref:Uncharacterized protein n=1 Tax=Steinernema glaseri TaxID=37863 RepID=A0A1I7Z6Y1_9BILA
MLRRPRIRETNHFVLQHPTSQHTAKVTGVGAQKQAVRAKAVVEMNLRTSVRRGYPTAAADSRSMPKALRRYDENSANAEFWSSRARSEIKRFHWHTLEIELIC